MCIRLETKTIVAILAVMKHETMRMYSMCCDSTVFFDDPALAGKVASLFAAGDIILTTEQHESVLDTSIMMIVKMYSQIQRRELKSYLTSERRT